MDDASPGTVIRVWPRKALSSLALPSASIGARKLVFWAFGRFLPNVLGDRLQLGSVRFRPKADVHRSSRHAEDLGRPLLWSSLAPVPLRSARPGLDCASRGLAEIPPEPESLTGVSWPDRIVAFSGRNTRDCLSERRPPLESESQLCAHIGASKYPLLSFVSQTDGKLVRRCPLGAPIIWH